MPELLQASDRRGLRRRVAWRRVSANPMLKHALSIALAVSVGANIWLLRLGTEQALRISALTKRPALEVGARLPEIDLRDLEGRPVRLEYSRSKVPTIVYVLSPTCVWCDRNMPAIKQLAAAVAGRFQVVGLAIGEKSQLAKYAAALPFPLYTDISDADAKAYRLQSTPMTVVVGSDGVVAAVWPGAFARDVKTNVESFFGLLLPEIDLSVNPPLPK